MAVVDKITSSGTGSGTKLRRDIGLVGLLWASVGSIIGSGWLFGAKNAVMVAGPAAVISWGIGAVAIVLLALVHAELGGLFPVSGGTARYPHYAFGGLAGMSFGWFSWLQAATVAPIEVEAMIGYSAYWKKYVSFFGDLQHTNGTLTVTGFVVAVVLMAAFVAVNFLGVRLLARTNSAATWWKVAVPLFVIFILALTNFHPSNFTSHGFLPYGVKGVLGAISGSGIIFSLLGFEQAIQLSGESKNPKKDIPRAVIGSVVIGTLIYTLLQVVYIGALPGSSFVHGWAHLAYQGIEGPFAGLATVIGLGWLALILRIDAVISPGGTGLIYTTSTSRISYGLSRNGYTPKIFEKTESRGVPWFGLIMAFITGVICFLPFPSWQALVGFISSASVLMYAGAPLALGVFRKRLPNRERPYVLPAAEIISPIAFVVAGLIIYWSGWDTLWRLGVAIVLGYVLLGSYAAYAIAKNLPDAPKMNFKSAQWLPVYLIGLGVISKLGGFGGLNDIPLWWDMVVVAAFSLGIYYWARAVALPTEEIERNIGTIEVVDEGGH
ncbi:APC family permease [Kitasatospora sp. GAS204B]|uniref:APC family permease n=1 Tax=unclassified Kitasatospora TaxID=2633591 RepID=UPI002475C13E|nr:APC family permease [Kitasatospora sp. GAS204B]MDH6119038.1 amino acid transporter [Kitasatospora sp. GAS204B]